MMGNNNKTGIFLRLLPLLGCAVLLIQCLGKNSNSDEKKVESQNGLYEFEIIQSGITPILIKGQQKNRLFLVLMASRTDGKDVFFSKSFTNISDPEESLRNILSNRQKESVYLVSKGQRVDPNIVHIERNFGLSKSRNIYIEFFVETNKNNRLVLNDFILPTGYLELMI